MPLQKVKLKPGIDRSNTNYANEGGYYACDKVRFRYGFPQKIGGWVKYVTTPFIGTARNLFNWVTLDNKNLLAVATSRKYYLESSGGLYDITPLRATVTLGTNAFASELGSTTLTVTHTNHGAAVGDYVTYSGAATLAGIPAANINIEHSIVEIVSASKYTILVSTPANATTTGGGAAIVAAYQLSVGADIAVPGLGWNAGTWGRSTWNSAADAATFSQLRLWSQESFGEDHVFCTRNGQIYYWDFTLGLTSRAVPITTLVGVSNPPLMATELLFSPTDRHLIAFGTNPIGSAVQDPLLIRWADTESVTNWTPAVTNAAGDLRCSSGNRIITAVKLKQEILIITDGSVFAMQSVGAPEIFGIQPVSDNISIISPNAIVVTGNSAFWMGNDKFYIYSGRTETLPCTLTNLVFDDINLAQADQFFAGTNEGFSEIWWFYCSANSNTVDRYVIYNYDEKTWAYGTMGRSAWLDSPLKSSPIAAGNGYLYYHENGVDDDRITPIEAFVESSDFNLGDGEDFSFVKRILPDVEFTGSEVDNPVVQITLTPRNSPGGAYTTKPSNTVTRSTQLPYEQFTERLDVRMRGRQMRLRIDSNTIGVQWQLGVPRIEIQPDGKK